MCAAFEYEFYEDAYSFRLIAPKTWLIETKSPDTPWGCDCYLLEGEEYAILIDSGMSRRNLKVYLDELKLVHHPILGVINTHSHFDHTGGNAYFGHAYMHQLAVENARKSPFKGENTMGYELDYKITCVGEGDLLELGNRSLKILEIGAHDPSSIAILDTGARMLFSGDELETGWINVGSMNPVYHAAETIESHYENMLKLKKYRKEYDMICPGHHGSPVAGETLEHFLICDRMILEGVPGSTQNPKKNGDGGSFAPQLRVMRYQTAHMCYRQDRIFKRKDLKCR